MLGIGPLEMIVILGLALIVLGPEKFPEAGRMVGKAMREFRAMTTDITRDLSNEIKISDPDDDLPPARSVPENTVNYDEIDWEALEREAKAEYSDAVEDAAPVLEDATPNPPEKNEPGPV